MRHAKVDANQVKIVAALRDIGCFVQSLAAIGKGCPDLLVGKNNKWHVFEIKDGEKILSKRQLTDAEKEWHDKAKRYAPVHVVESVDQAIEIVTKEA